MVLMAVGLVLEPLLLSLINSMDLQEIKEISLLMVKTKRAKDVRAFTDGYAVPKV